MIISNKWQDYKILDAGDGEKLESVGKYILRRPDSQVIWKKTNESIWNKVDAHYHRSNKGGGYWQYNKKIESPWTISYNIDSIDNNNNMLKFIIEPTSFKHISIFPEQAPNWQFIYNAIRSSKRPINVLNLFAYTGAATVACALANANEVVHVDSAKKMVELAKKNININNLNNKKVRFIVDDVMKFVLREGRRNNKYDAIIMDPPVYGRGPSGELWQIERSLADLIYACKDILSPHPLFFIINCYTTSISHISLKNILALSLLKDRYGSIESGEIGIPIENTDMVLPTGIYARYSNSNN